MGQKCNPIGFRVGITEGWKSRWYAPKAAFGTFLVEDEKIRRFIDDALNKKPPYAGISRTEVERTRDEVKVILHTARPGVVIGAKGAEVDRLKERLEDLIDRRVGINIVEIRNPRYQRPPHRSLNRRAVEEADEFPAGYENEV